MHRESPLRSAPILHCRLPVGYCTMSWQNALVQYAKTPPAKVARDVYLAHDAHTLTICDKFPKARYHFLCLPRLPMRLSTSAPAGSALYSGTDAPDKAEEEEEEDAAPIEGAGDTVSETQLHSLANLLSCKHGLRVLRLLKSASEEAGSLVSAGPQQSPAPTYTFRSPA